MAFGKLSNPVMTVAPVVVSPENASNTAEATVKWGESNNSNGKVARPPKTNQNATTIKKPSRDRNSCLW